MPSIRATRLGQLGSIIRTLDQRAGAYRGRANGILVVIIVCCASGGAADELSQDGAKRTVRYNRDIRPILSNHCFTCHGPDGNRLEADLRLDDAESAFEDRGDYRAIAPGDPTASELLIRITSEEPDERMPPGEQPLDGDDIGLIRQWIQEGATYEPHWAWSPVRRPDIPEPKSVDGLANPIDRFVQSHLDTLGLALSPATDSRTLARRVAFDLTGLPPTIAEVDEFGNADERNRAEMIDCCLRSPAYGERMASMWLDLVRYADTNGIHGDNHREVSAYRDYVIRAFNNNMPFDQFTIEQLAGDMLPSPDDWQLVASGYNRLNCTTNEGGAQPKEYRAKYAADRVRNVSTVWLGSTVGCAECHDHKFDRFTMGDFYSLAAFFADLEEVAVGVQPPGLSLPEPEQAAELERLDQEIASVRANLEAPSPEFDAARQRWETAVADSEAHAWTAIGPTAATTGRGSPIEIVEDNVIHAARSEESRDEYVIVLPIPEPLSALRLEVLADPSLPGSGPGLADNGNFVLSEIEFFAGDQRIANPDISASFEQTGFAATAAVDGDPKSGWAVAPETGSDHTLTFVWNEPVIAGKAPATTELRITIRQNFGSWHQLGKFRFSRIGTSGEFPIEALRAVPDGIAEILDISDDERSDAQREQLNSHYRGIAPLTRPLRDRLSALETERKSVSDQIRTMLISKSIEPRTTRILPRGNWLDETGEVVDPAVPEFLAHDFQTDQVRASRHDLANWLVSPENPLVARVFVNRLWHVCFGEGLVRTLDDFGSQGDWPTHIDLLNWLAVEFVESGWDVKHIVRLITTSRTYQQTSQSSKQLEEIDPDNRLFARQNAYRLDAEMVRDNALAVAGILSSKIGGRSVKPYQPAGYWAHLNFPTRSYQADTGEAQFRRGLYTYWCRTFLHPSMLAFDAPSREECSVVRPRSSTPLQALVLLNDPTYVEAAKELAQSVIDEGSSTDADRISQLWHRALQRDPTSTEIDVMAQHYAEQHDQFLRNPAAAESLLAVGQLKVSPGVDLVELAAWTQVARALLNLHEFIMRY